MKITKTQLKQIIKEEIHKVLSEAPNREFVGSVDELPDAPMGGDVPGASEHQYDWMKTDGLKHSYEVAIKLDRKELPEPEELRAAQEELLSDYGAQMFKGDIPSAGAYTGGASDETARKYQEEYKDLDMAYHLYRDIDKAMRRHRKY